MCNVLSRHVWGDSYLSQLKHMLQDTCATRAVPDCEFFINKRDFPHLRADLTEPYAFLYDDPRTGEACAQPPPLRRHRYRTYAPITSFYFCDAFADLPFPVTDDWETATGLVFPPAGNDGRSAKKRERFQVGWGDKRKTALFRGAATGGGTCVEDNQRLKLAALSHAWSEDARYGEGNAVDGERFLDAGVVQWNFRDKKVGGRPMSFVDPRKLGFGTVEFVPMYEQVGGWGA